MTPDPTVNIYVEETPMYPPSVAEVATAVPAFIGNTEKAKRIRNGDLKNKPFKIRSMLEYEQYFGVGKREAIVVSVRDDRAGGFITDDFKVGNKTADKVMLPSHLLYYAVRMFFDNGGRECYIVSVGNYRSAISLGTSGVRPAGVLGGLDALVRSLPPKQSPPTSITPTLVVVPEAVLLPLSEFATFAEGVLAQCAALGDRFAILDVHDGDIALHTNGGNDATAMIANRSAFGTLNLKYGAAYYPFVRTTMPYSVSSATPSNVKVVYAGASVAAGGKSKARQQALDKLGASNRPLFDFVNNVLANRFIVMPPSAAIAGVYAAVDTARGVWKAPATVPLTNVTEPVLDISYSQQEELNVDPIGGKSINTIRAFPGKGTLVWGARTLAGNDNEWRYVSVRRFFIMVEDSIKQSTEWVIFEPNNASTWAKVRGMIENYLTQKWREGALIGTTPKDAFFVRCALGSTMTAQDILDGRLNVEIGMAPIRPAEFTILRFTHQMQS